MKYIQKRTFKSFTTLVIFIVFVLLFKSFAKSSSEIIPKRDSGSHEISTSEAHLFFGEGKQKEGFGDISFTHTGENSDSKREGMEGPELLRVSGDSYQGDTSSFSAKKPEFSKLSGDLTKSQSFSTNPGISNPCLSSSSPVQTKRQSILPPLPAPSLDEERKEEDFNDIDFFNQEESKKKENTALDEVDGELNLANNNDIFIDDELLEESSRPTSPSFSETSLLKENTLEDDFNDIDFSLSPPSKEGKIPLYVEKDSGEEMKRSPAIENSYKLTFLNDEDSASLNNLTWDDDGFGAGMLRADISRESSSEPDVDGKLAYWAGGRDPGNFRQNWTFWSTDENRKVLQGINNGDTPKQMVSLKKREVVIPTSTEVVSELENHFKKFPTVTANDQREGGNLEMLEKTVALTPGLFCSAHNDGGEAGISACAGVIKEGEEMTSKQKLSSFMKTVYTPGPSLSPLFDSERRPENNARAATKGHVIKKARSFDRKTAAQQTTKKKWPPMVVRKSREDLGDNRPFMAAKSTNNGKGCSIGRTPRFNNLDVFLR